MGKYVLAALGLAVFLAGAEAAGSWRIVKDRWSPADEAGFSRFVAAIGMSNCSSAQSCLRDPANPYRDGDKRFVDVDADCAKWPYLLRGYYAWKNGLPFSYVDGVGGRGGDLRYGKHANRPVGRRDAIDRGEGIDGPAVLRRMLDEVNSSTYRMDPSQTGKPLADFYSPAVWPGSIRPGTLIYDINGHVGIVYKVEPDGRIRYMDAHPDFTITRSVYGAQFGQSPMRLGGGLKNWRPLQLVGAHGDGKGHLIGGRMVPADNDQIPDFSLMQYLGTEPNPDRDEKQARFFYDGEEMGFYSFVRTAVSGGRMDFNPLHELKSTIRTLCNDLNDRAQYIDLAISKRIDKQPHPSRLPDNIYGTDDGEWENYATPSRDARIKAAFAQAYRDLGAMIELWVGRDPRLNYDGIDLQADLRRIYARESKACTITYLNSAKRPVAMDFDAMSRRLFAMSFDPYHCIELRWGAQGQERESCPSSPAKLRWYEAERRLRNQTERTYEARMGFTLKQLDDGVTNSGADAPPPVHLPALIESMPPRRPLKPMTPVGR